MSRIIFTITLAFEVFCMVLFDSCSDSDYINAIPSNSTALISIDMPKIMASNHATDKEGGLKSLFRIDNMNDCGIDVSEKMYFFETVDGNLGICAKVLDESDLENYFNKLAKEQHVCTEVVRHKDFCFTVLKKSWVVGFSDKALLVLGPVVAEAQAELRQQMVKYLKSDEEHGIAHTSIYECLDTINSAMALVAQVQALPEKFVAPIILGAPKNADAIQINVAAEMEVVNGILRIKGKPFSLNHDIDRALKEASENYRPIKGRYIASMPQDAMIGIFMNVDGRKFLPMMQSSKEVRELLLGINTAVDMDNIIRSVNGDMAIVMSTLGKSPVKLTMAAELANSKWLNDVSYWKSSCPKGGAIADWGKNSYFYTNGGTSFYFGVSEDLQFFSGSDELLAYYSIKPSNHPISEELRKEIIGQKLAMVINLASSSVGNDAFSIIAGLLNPVFGNINSIVYTLK